jgi:hypothetical protein
MPPFALASLARAVGFASLCIGRGVDHDDVEWLGAWDWDGAACWRLEE